MNPPPSTIADPPKSSVQSVQKRSTAGHLILLGAATVALIGFILLMGDIRRKSAALKRAEVYAAELTGRVGESGTLPLDLTTHEARDVPSQSFRFETLGRDEAFRLREREGDIMVAWTGLIRGDVLPEGRAAVFFMGKLFSARWVKETDFARQRTAQAETPHGG